jgi:hypothetical protein
MLSAECPRGSERICPHEDLLHKLGPILVRKPTSANVAKIDCVVYRDNHAGSEAEHPEVHAAAESASGQPRVVRPRSGVPARGVERPGGPIDGHPPHWRVWAARRAAQRRTCTSVISCRLELATIVVAGAARKRLRELQVGSPVELKLTLTRPYADRGDAEAVSDELYPCFAGRRVRGSWYPLTVA